jgi:NADH-quinone oxidoreductase subunit C
VTDVSVDPTVARICAQFDGCAPAMSFGQAVVVVPTSQLLEVAQFCVDDGFDGCLDVTSVDYLEHWDRDMGDWTGERTRFEVVVNLLDMGLSGGSGGGTARRLRLRVPVDEDTPVCPSLAFIWPSADCAEREVYDLMGIEFEGHPDLTRVLMPDDWEGHPLRKDYVQARIPVTFTGDLERPGTPVKFISKPRDGGDA